MDQRLRWASVMENGFSFSDSGQIAPSFTHLVRSAICAVERDAPFFGIISAGLVWRTAVIKRLLSGSPGTMAGPVLPPFNIPSRESSRRPPSFAVVWQLKH